MQILDGKAIAGQIINELKAEVESHVGSIGYLPHLTVILIGNDGASETYVNNKLKACKRAGLQATLIRPDSGTSHAELISLIDALNRKAKVDGIIVQMPIPEHFNEAEVVQAISPAKDVDGFHPNNLGKLAQGQNCLAPATPAGVIELLKRYNISVKGKHCVVVGRSAHVGLPLALLISQNAETGNGTLTLCHSYTPNLASYTQQADILLVAAGKPNLIKADMIKPGAVLIDIGIHRIADPNSAKGYAIIGDIEVNSAVRDKCSFLSPVPGGVGPMTIAMLLQNTVKAWKTANQQS